MTGSVTIYTTERWLALRMAITAIFTLAGYESLRSAATVLLKTAYGPDILPIAMATTPFITLIGLWAYGKLLTALGPRRTVVTTTLGFSLLIALLFIAIRGGLQPATMLLFWLKEFYIVLLIEQYWSYLNSKLTEPTARRLNGPITGVAGFGSIMGGWIVSIAAVPLGTEALLLIGAATLLPAAWLVNATYRHFGEPAAREKSQSVDQRSALGWSLIRSDRRLAALLAVVLVTQMLSSLLELKFQNLSSLAYVGQRDAETAFQGQFWFYLNSIALFSQFLLTPFLLTRFSLRQVHLLMPTIQLGAIGWALLAPSLWSVGAAFMAFKTLDYSLFRGAKELVYLPLSFDGRYRTKELIDVFGYRSGKAISSLGIAALQRTGFELTAYFLPAAFALGTLWMGLTLPMTTKRITSTDDQASANLR